MASKSVGTYLVKTLDSVISSSAEAERRRTDLLTVARKLFQYPLKVMVLFVASPYLLFLVVKSEQKDKLQRATAAVGFVLAFVAAYVAFRLLNVFVISLFIWNYLGATGLVAFFFSSITSLVIALVFCVWLFFLIAWVFLHMSSSDIVKALQSEVEDAK